MVIPSIHTLKFVSTWKGSLKVKRPSVTSIWARQSKAVVLALSFCFSPVHAVQSARPMKDKALVRIDSLVYFTSDFKILKNSLQWMICQNNGKASKEISSLWKSLQLPENWWKTDIDLTKSIPQSHPHMMSLVNFLKIVHFYRLQGRLARPNVEKSKSKCRNLWSDDYRQWVSELNNLEILLGQLKEGEKGSELNLGLQLDRILGNLQYEFFN